MERKQVYSDEVNIFLKSIVGKSKNIVIFALDSKYRYVVFNETHFQTMKNIWGSEISLGNNMLDYINDPADRLKAKKNFDRALSGESFNLIEEYGDTEYDRRFYDVVYNPVNNENNNIIGISVILTDITEERKAKKALEESEAMLKESNALKDKFFDIISHDLKDSFNSMLNFSSLLNNNFDTYDQERKKKFVNIIDIHVQGTYKLLQNLLTWSRLQKGKLSLNLQKLNLYELGNEVIQIMNQSAINKQIEIVNQIPENIFINADKNMLSAVIRNLLSNAVKFTLRGDKIHVVAKSIKSKNNKKYIEISVKDNGVGIRKEKQSKLFKISESVTTKGTENEKGTGLGLILCKEFVEKHGGEIWVESKIKEGTSFYFTIPDRKI